MTSRGTQFWNGGSIPLIAPEILGDIIASLADMAVVISNDGTVLSILANPIHSAFADLNHWERRNIREVLTTESVAKFERHLGNFLKGEDRSRSIEINHVDKVENWEFPVNYTFHTIGPEGVILMLGRDLRPIAEMQQQLVNAQIALERDYEARRESEARFRVLLETAQDAIVYISLGSGRITEANTAAARLLGMPRDDLIDASFAQEFSGRRREELMEQLLETAQAEGSGAIVLETLRSRRSVRATPTLFRASGERLVVCRLAAKSDRDGAADRLTQNLLGLYHNGGDAIVFTNRDGIVTAANEAFMGLAEVSGGTECKGRSFSEFLHRGTVDLKVLLDNTARAGAIRMYSTRLIGEFGSQRMVEISATFLADGLHPAFAFAIRDASRAEVVRQIDGPTTTADEATSVRELVGSATLKEIVTDTTDVIEKMCIETAIELTGNNRVAAAEMLGLSRQSLYVKLRKFDLIER